MQKQILGVKIDDISLRESLEQVEQWLKGNDKHYIVTPNPEFLVEAQSNNDFKKILNNADLSIPDGVGLKLAGIKNRVAGVDLMEELIQFASVKGLKIGLVGGKEKVAEELAERLKSKYPNLKISISDSFGVLPPPHLVVHPRSTSLAAASRQDLSEESPLAIPQTDLLFVAFGAPKQEKWISDNLEKIPVKVAMGVGGSFDYLAGRVPRAPKLVRSLGFEWLFRLTMQPWRIKRQLRLLKYLWLLRTKNS